MNPAYPAEELRDSGVVIVSIGIGSFVNTLELQKISGPTGQVYQFSDTDQLNRQFLDSLINTTCSAAAVPVLSE